MDIMKEIGSHAMLADMTRGIFKDSHAKTAKKYISIGIALHDKAFKKWDYTNVNQITPKQVKTALYKVYKKELLFDFKRLSPFDVKSCKKQQAKCLKQWLNEYN